MRNFCSFSSVFYLQLGTFYVKCIQWRNGCPVRAKVFENQLILTMDHTHMPDQNEIELLKLRERIYQAVMVSNDSVKELFDQQCRNSTVGHLLSFASIQRSLRMARQRSQSGKY